ncbi:hypothetical protein F5Y03DRAFT_403279 [Xylaria venustula]|nr:hypothetical protein F5Y03DRAFT_403279 [Xylaria venustula]
MSLNVAPYNTAMRIGQGFNSYTHEICINDAVIVDDEKPGGDHFSADNNQVSQMVTYCTKYVDKVSEVTDAMSVSAALSIKTASAGGGLSGSYVDADKFKESDINFFVQVKVTNQVIMAEDVTKFNSIKGINGGGEFTSVFGDSFISGFVEGGELDAIVSIKCKDQAASTNIKAALEANFGKGGVGGSLNAAFSKDHANALNESQTTITVNWCGGGNIKPKDTLWSIESLTQAAASFPQNVADCPQRIYAILTKYTALRSFQTLTPRITPLLYDNAALYTNDLLDAYMDYKSIWKQIHVDNANLAEGLIELSKAENHRPLLKDKPQEEDRMSLIEDVISYMEGSTSANKSHDERIHDFRDHDFQAYEPTFSGLQKARKDCRFEMLKIVNEVDAVTNDPMIALQQERDCGYVNPQIFRKLLPIVKEKPKAGDLASAGASFYKSTEKPPREVQNWLNLLKSEQVTGFEMTGFAGEHKDYNPGKFVHQFETVNRASIVSKIDVWVESNHIAALKVYYVGDKPAPQEIRSPPSGVTAQTFSVTGNERITSLVIHASNNDIKDTKVVHGITLSTDMLNSKFLGHAISGGSNVEYLKTKAPMEGWSFKGFWAQTGSAIDRLGAFWGEDEKK